MVSLIPLLLSDFGFPLRENENGRSNYRGGPNVRNWGRPMTVAKTVGWPPPGGNIKILPGAFASATKR
jgi:hypothetical protein